MFNLGFMYMNGEGTRKDYYEAFNWFKKAAEFDYAKAVYMVGYFYSEGLGPVYTNSVEARKWYKKAADLGDEDAKRALRENY